MPPGSRGWICDILGTCRCDRKRPESDTTIHSRSNTSPRGSTSEASTGMPRADLRGYTTMEATRPTGWPCVGMWRGERGFE